MAANLSIADVADRLEQGAPAQGRGPARPRGAAIPGARRHAGDRSARPGRPGHRREERPVDPAARPGPGDDRARGPDDGDPVQRQGRRRPDRLPPPGGQCAGGLARPEGRAGRRRQERPAGRRDPARLRPGAAGPDGDRQRPRRHRHRRPHERRRSSSCSSRACEPP